ncbi:MAG: LacI family DNA-binding transcriptional regulator [Kiritimatiellae bacterium]|nr:LacI family DNA-binding transcriptional regulator [Kiritimatiellia bacterium]
MGARAITLTDVASRANVSRTAAAKVLLGTGGDHVRVGDDARQRIEEAAEALHYHPNRAAQQLRGVNTQMVGVLMDTLNAPVMNDRLAAVEREAYQRGYRLLIGQLHGDLAALRDYLADFNSRGVDAILCLFDVTHGRVERLKPILGERAGIVMHAKPLEQDGYCVRVDTAGAITTLIEHLLDSGRQRIGLQLEGVPDELMTVRKDAYLAAMAASGRSPDPSLIWTARSETVDPTAETIRETIDNLIEKEKVDAIVAPNDVWAAHLIQGLKARGYDVPGDVAVTGYDNLDLATIIDPPLTTIDQQHHLYAAAALDLLTAIASRTAEPPPGDRTIVVEPKLIVRSSA